MLTEAHTILPAADLKRFRGYYHDKLGMDPVEEHDDMLVYRSGSSEFEVYETDHAGTAQNTQMVWMTDDLDAEMRRMQEAGIEFDDVDVPGVKTDENRVATTDDMKAAWFHDSEGNILCITEMTR